MDTQNLRALFEARAKEAGWGLHREPADPARYAELATQLRWEGYALGAQGATVLDLETAQVHSLELRDKAGNRLMEGDIVLGYRYWMDGYLPKAYPEKVRELLRIQWNPTIAAFELIPQGWHPDDEQFATSRRYRRLGYLLKGTKPSHGRPNMLCESLERYTPPQANTARPLD